MLAQNRNIFSNQVDVFPIYRILSLRKRLSTEKRKHMSSNWKRKYQNGFSASLVLFIQFKAKIFRFLQLKKFFHKNRFFSIVYIYSSRFQFEVNQNSVSLKLIWEFVNIFFIFIKCKKFRLERSAFFIVLKCILAFKSLASNCGLVEYFSFSNDVICDWASINLYVISLISSLRFFNSSFKRRTSGSFNDFGRDIRFKSLFSRSTSIRRPVISTFFSLSNSANECSCVVLITLILLLCNWSDISMRSLNLDNSMCTISQ